MLQEVTRVPTRTGGDARSATDDQVTESGAFIADEELAPDAVCSASFRGRTVTVEGCVSYAYLMGAGTPPRLLKTYSRFTEVRRPRATLTAVSSTGSSSVRTLT